MRRQAGFSLLELVVAIIIFGLIAGLSIPFFHTFVSNYRLKGAVSTLRGDLQKARSLARANRMTYTLDFTGTDSYRIVDAGGNEVLTRTLARNVSRTSGDDITFEPIGRSTATTVRLVNDRGEQYDLRITIAGMIEVS